MQHETRAPSIALSDHKPSRTRATIALQLSLLGLLVLLALLNYPFFSRDLWTDEAYTVSYTAHPTVGALLDDVRKNEETPPLYFVTAWLWARLFGQGPVPLRALSALYGAGAALALAGLASRRLAPAEAAVAVATLASAPLLQQYLVEARGYTMTALLTVACVVAFEQLYRCPESRRAQLAYALSAAALFLTSYFSVALLAAHWLLSLWLLRDPATRQERLVGWGLVHLIVFACVLPWLPSLRYQLLVAPAVTVDVSSGLQDYLFLPLQSLVGDLAQGPRLLGAAAGFTLMLAAALGDRERQGLVLRALLLPAAALFLMVAVMHVVAARYLMVLLPGSAIAAGVGFAALRGRRPWMAWLIAALFALSILAARLEARPKDPTGAWDRLAAQVAAQADPAGDIVLFHPPWDQRIFEHYYAGPELVMAGAHHYDDFYYTEGYIFRQTWTVAEAMPVVAGHRRVWVVYDQLHHQVPALRLPYRQIGHWSEGRLELFLYEVTAP